jgi:hypothetical protein
VLLAQGRMWRAKLVESSKQVRVAVLKDGIGDEKKELAEFALDVPLAKWGVVVKHIRNDRKLVGGVVLEFASDDDQLPLVLASDRLFGELQRVVVDATVTLVECGALVLRGPESG